MSNNPYGFTNDKLRSRSEQDFLHRRRRRLVQQVIARQKLDEADRLMKRADRLAEEAWDAKPRVSVSRLPGYGESVPLSGQPARKSGKERPAPPKSPAGGLALQIDDFAKDLQCTIPCLRPTFHDDERKLLQGAITRLHQQLSTLTKRLDSAAGTTSTNQR